MAYIDKRYFEGYTTTKILEDEFPILAERASDIIDALTLHRIGGATGLTRFPARTQEYIRKATAAQYSQAYFTSEKEEWDALETLLDRRETLLYRDCLGNHFYCTIGNYTHTQENDRIKFALSITRADFVEGIAGVIT